MMADAASWLSSQHSAHWIEPHQKYSLLNHRARDIIQTNRRGSTAIWNRTINGEGQIIAHGDTGVDYDSCFFYDPAVVVPVNSVNLNNSVCCLFIVSQLIVGSTPMRRKL
jgi:subtilisin family serine protease